MGEEEEECLRRGVVRKTVEVVSLPRSGWLGGRHRLGASGARLPFLSPSTHYSWCLTIALQYYPPLSLIPLNGIAVCSYLYVLNKGQTQSIQSWYV